MLRDAAFSYAPVGISNWNVYNAYSTTDPEKMNLIESNYAGKDAVMWSTSTLSMATTLCSNFVIKLRAKCWNNDMYSKGYTIFLVDGGSRVIPAANRVAGKEFGVQWSAFNGLVVFGGVKNIYSYYSHALTNPGSIPSCNHLDADTGDYKCGSWGSVAGNIHDLIVAIDNARYMRVTVCVVGTNPCVPVHSYNYLMPTPLTNLTGPLYFGIASRSDGVVTSAGSTIYSTYIYAVDFYKPALFCPNDCSGQGFCLPGFVCSCHYGYTGALCATAICNPPCANGGTCYVANTCMCPSGYGGNDCSLSLFSFFVY